MLKQIYVSGITGTGIVIAGFGSEELFPSLSNYQIFKLFNGKPEEKIESKVPYINHLEKHIPIKHFLME